MKLYSFFQDILNIPIGNPLPWKIGKTRQGRKLPAYKFGNGDFRISLIGGCHADEPTGPRLLKKLVTFLDTLPDYHWLLQRISWYIVPHVNPDGEELNKKWYCETDELYDLAAFLNFRVRELPGDDLEYGFPIEGHWPPLRPENKFVHDCWLSANRPFHLHASLHGMGWANGAWYLLESTWIDRAAPIIWHNTLKAQDLGYELFDVDRKGEKGFSRIGLGFSTRPDSVSMRRFFLQKNDTETAAKFHPSSMESIRSLGGDCLTLVTEMPLFIYPSVNKTTDWPNPDFERWSQMLAVWTACMSRGDLTEAEVNQFARNAGLKPMPVSHQMYLQWQYICSSIETSYAAAIA